MKEILVQWSILILQVVIVGITLGYIKKFSCMLLAREEIYSAMIVYGFLSYYDGTIRIPNKELMKEFEKALKDESFGEVMTIVKNSSNMLKATLKKDTKEHECKVEKIN